MLVVGQCAIDQCVSVVVGVSLFKGALASHKLLYTKSISVYTHHLLCGERVVDLVHVVVLIQRQHVSCGWIGRLPVCACVCVCAL